MSTPAGDVGTVRIVLVPSPLTGPVLWRGVRDALWSLGQRAYVAQLTDPQYIYPPFWLTQAASLATGLPEEDAVVLVAHSGAGVLLPAIRQYARNRDRSADVVAQVYVDCDLPRDGCSRLDLFDDADAAARLRKRAADGWMPSFSDAELAPLIPDSKLRSEFLAGLPRISIDLYEEKIRVPQTWPDTPCAYLRLSEHYPSSVCRAKELGWPLEAVPGHHFLPFTDPVDVAGAIVRLVETLLGPLDSLPAKPVSD